MALNIIDFSNGIRPEEIQENFEYLQNQLSRERASVGGVGIASGLEIIVHADQVSFEIELTGGSIIDEDGEEIFIDGKRIPIDPPILYQYKETLNLSSDRTVQLKHVPYSLDRRLPAQYASSYEPEISGITIKHRGSLYSDDFIRVRNIQDRVITVAGALLNDLEVTYSYTAKRIDTLYIDKNLNIQVKEGTTSTTPSAILPLDAKYLIAYLEIDSEFIDEDYNVPHAHIYVKNDLRSIRNLYTDSEGTLYICGIPFDDLQIIHLKEPENPKPNTLWLNMGDNTLYCWRATDEFIYKNKIEVTTDFIEQDNAELIFSTYMDYNIGENELSVYLNDSLLRLNIDYEEISNDLPTYAGNEGESFRGNQFRILQSINRPDDFKDVLIQGDVLTYLIKYKDSQYMWVPVNKMSYIPVKHSRVYSTSYEGISEKYKYESDDQTTKAYFDSSIANNLDKNELGESTLGKTHDYPYKYQYFIFDREKDLDMHFTPGRKQLSIMINQMFLHEDQFEEITIFDLLDDSVKIPPEVKAAAKTHFKWTPKYINDLGTTGNSFDNTGIGFMLAQPLDAGINADNIGSDYDSIYGSNDLFVEAIVEHRVCATPTDRKLQRSATFIYEDTAIIKDDFNGIIHLEGITYRFNEHQLEVFADGRKLVEGEDYIEEYGFFKQVINKDGTTENIIKEPIIVNESYKDQDYFYRKKAAVCSMFKLLKEELYSAQIVYKITTNVYSYDHINNILDDIGGVLESCKTITDGAAQRMNEVEDRIDDVYNRVIALEENQEEYDPKYLTNESILSVSQMPNIIISNAIKSMKHINTSISLKTGQLTYSLNSLNGGREDIWVDDYINIFHHDSTNNIDSYWVPGLHYEITEVSYDGKPICYLRILKPEIFNGGDTLYISGIKLSTNRPLDGFVYDIKIATKEDVENLINTLFVTLINNNGGGDLNG